jgi:hypothetical protein
MITPPLSMSAIPRFTRCVPLSTSGRAGVEAVVDVAGVDGAGGVAEVEGIVEVAGVVGVAGVAGASVARSE